MEQSSFSMDSLHPIKQTALYFLIFVFVVGCATFPAGPPAGVFTADVGFPPLGTKWLYRRVDQRGTTGTTMFTVLEEGTYQGKPVYRVDVGGLDIYIYDKATANKMALIRGGKELFASLPHDGALSWPLWVGKSWTATYTWYDREYGLTERDVNISWKVEAYEDVETPAGRWKAFRLHMSSRGGTVLSIFWYAPEVRFVVKAVHEQTSRHPLGYGKRVDEVIEYHPAK